MFECSALDFFCPEEDKENIAEHVEVDLLMEPTKDFPGIISPKVALELKNPHKFIPYTAWDEHHYETQLSTN